MKAVAPLAIALAVALSSGAALAQSNAVSAVDVVERADATEIRIHGVEHPSYSVYRLRNPLRLFIDIADSGVSAPSAAIDVDNGVVAQVAATEYTDEVSTVARVVVGFDQDALYDVDTEGDTLVITVDGAGRNLFVGRDPSTMEDFALLTDELAASSDRVASLEAALADAAGRSEDLQAEILESNLARERAERDRLAALAAQNDLSVEVRGLQRQNADAAQRVASLEAANASRDQALATQQARVGALERERADALARIESLQREAAANEAATASRDAALARLEGQLADANAAVTRAQEAGARAEALSPLLDARDAQLAALQSERVELAELAEQNRQTQADLEVALATARRAQSEQQSIIAAQASTIQALQQQQVATTGPVSDIRFEHVGGVDRVVIDVPSGVELEPLPSEDGRSTLTLAGTTLPDALRRTLDTQAFGGPVAFVSSYTDADGVVRIVAERGDVAAEFLRRDGDQIIWEFTGDADIADSALGTAAPTVAAGAVTSDAPYRGDAARRAGQYEGSDVDNPIADLPFLRRPVMTRKRITIDLRQADIQNVIRLIADEGNINVVSGVGVQGYVTVRLRSVPLDDALMVILRSQGLGWEQTGNILRVAPLSEFQAAYDAGVAEQDSAWRREALSVRLIPVSYASANDLSGLVGGVLSTRGRVVVDRRNNALIVTDLRDNLDTAAALVARVDTQTPQILIEARIVETNDQFRRQLGIQWGGDYLADQSIGNATGLLFPSTIGIAGGAADGTTPTAGTSSQPNFAVNLPAPAGTGEGGAIGFTFGSLAGAFNLNVRLSAAESAGTIKVVSAPRIMASDNVAATITSGVSVPVQVVSAAGAQTVFFDASLELNVTPRVTPDGNVFLTVRISKNEPDFENTGARGDPSIIRREAATELLVRSGDTTVIGGIFQRNTGYSQNRVPFFGSLPVIGPLFRSSSQTDVRNELLVFITPRIVNRDASIGALSSGVEIESPDR